MSVAGRRTRGSVGAVAIGILGVDNLCGPTIDVREQYGDVPTDGVGVA